MELSCLPSPPNFKHGPAALSTLKNGKAKIWPGSGKSLRVNSDSNTGGLCLKRTENAARALAKALVRLQLQYFVQFQYPFLRSDILVLKAGTH